MVRVDQRLCLHNRLPSRKANVVADALSWKSKLPKASLNAIGATLVAKLKSYNAVLSMEAIGRLIAHFQVRPT